MGGGIVQRKNIKKLVIFITVWCLQPLSIPLSNKDWEIELYIISLVFTNVSVKQYETDS